MSRTNGSPSRKAFFHGGFQKTASTYLQSLLNRNRQRVEERFFVVSPQINQDDVMALRTAVRAHWRRPDEARLRDVEARLAAIREKFLASSCSEMLLSDEGIIGPVFYAFGEREFYSRAETYLQAVRDTFADCETHYIFNVRDPEKWLKSVYNNSVRFSRNTQTYEEFRAWIRSEVDWDAALARFRAAVPDATVTFLRMDETSTEPFDVARTFLAYLGFAAGEIEAFRRVPRRNQSFPVNYLGLMRMLNESKLDDGAMRTVRRVLARHVQLEIDNVEGQDWRDGPQPRPSRDLLDHRGGGNT